MYLYYAMLPIRKLHFGVSRPKSWWDKHPNHVKMLQQLKKSIQKEGLRNPLTVDSTFTVQVGNQRLQALKDLKIKLAPCIVCTNEEKSFVEIKSRLHLKKYFRDGFKPFVNLTSITPKDSNEWNGDYAYGR